MNMLVFAVVHMCWNVHCKQIYNKYTKHNMASTYTCQQFQHFKVLNGEASVTHNTKKKKKEHIYRVEAQTLNHKTEQFVFILPTANNYRVTVGNQRITGSRCGLERPQLFPPQKSQRSREPLSCLPRTPKNDLLPIRQQRPIIELPPLRPAPFVSPKLRHAEKQYVRRWQWKKSAGLRSWGRRSGERVTRKRVKITRELFPRSVCPINF